mmetsp:Transcript_687/g.877  ORF Transcript_687/g.877 Transcript_687/m.877 type:complete len:87 (+) Transcript_687:624-884(+)
MVMLANCLNSSAIRTKSKALYMLLNACQHLYISRVLKEFHDHIKELKLVYIIPVYTDSKDHSIVYHVLIANLCIFLPLNCHHLLFQ